MEGLDLDTIIDKYYAGFEGEGEIQFIRVLKSGDKYVLRVCEGYFIRIMDAMEPEISNTGLYYQYSTLKGWYEKSPWQIPDLKEAIEQFENTNTKEFDEETLNVYNDIYNLLKSARDSKDEVWISEE